VQAQQPRVTAPERQRGDPVQRFAAGRQRDRAVDAP
jgi:hypothetical protein